MFLAFDRDRGKNNTLMTEDANGLTHIDPAFTPFLQQLHTAVLVGSMNFLYSQRLGA